MHVSKSIYIYTCEIAHMCIWGIIIFVDIYFTK